MPPSTCETAVLPSRPGRRSASRDRGHLVHVLETPPVFKPAVQVVHKSHQFYQADLSSHSNTSSYVPRGRNTPQPGKRSVGQGQVRAA